MTTPDVVIIGAGITGLSVAYHLAVFGERRVLILEKTGVGQGASKIAPGGVRRQWGTDINCTMSQQSYDFYQEINERLEPAQPLVFRKCGYLFLAYSERVLTNLKTQVALQQHHGIPSQVVTAGDVADLLPVLSTEGVTGAAYCPDDGYFDDPQAVVQAFADAVCRAGVEIVPEACVGIETANGKVQAVRTSAGRRFPCATVVNAAGCDAAEIAAMVGIAVPITPVARHLHFTAPVDERFLDPLVVAPERTFAAKQLHKGPVMLSGLSGEAADDPLETQQARVIDMARILVPRLGDLRIRHTVLGFYDSTPDHQPILGPVGQLDGFVMAAGMSGHGFMMAPAIGENVARSILGLPLTFDMGRLDLNRFAENRLVMEPAIV